MNRVRVIIEQDHGGADGAHRVVAQAVFPSAGFTLETILDVFEHALRGAGYHCPVEALRVERDE